MCPPGRRRCVFLSCRPVALGCRHRDPSAKRAVAGGLAAQEDANKGRWCDREVPPADRRPDRTGGTTTGSRRRRRLIRVRCPAVPSWEEIERAEPEFAGPVRRLFEAGRHKTIATLRSDGSPRISGIECEFKDGDLRFGSMTGARKGADLIRNPRFALHGPTFHPEAGKE